MFIYSDGRVEHFTDLTKEKKKVEGFSESPAGLWLTCNKDNLEKSILKKGSYEASFEKLEEKSDFEGGKLNIVTYSEKNVELKLTYNKVVDDETQETELTMELEVSDKKNGVYKVKDAPRRFVVSVKDKSKENLYYLILYKFKPEVPIADFDLTNIDADFLEKFTKNEKLNAYMIIELEYKPSYLLLIILVLFIIAIIVTATIIALR